MLQLVGCSLYCSLLTLSVIDLFEDDLSFHVQTNTRCARFFSISCFRVTLDVQRQACTSKEEHKEAKFWLFTTAMLRLPPTTTLAVK